MTFEKPNILLFLIFAPIILMMFHYFFLKRDKIIKSLFSRKNFEKIGVNRSRGLFFLKSLIIAIVFSLLIIALAGPRYGFKDINLSNKGKNIFIAVDTSLSMDATDVKPSRLILAKRKITDFVNLSKGERISLVPFAGEPYILIPLTNDYSIFYSFLDMVNTDIIPVQGTNFYNLINKITDIVSKHELGNVSLLIISDGEDFSGNIEKALELCKKNNIVIYTLGMGTNTPSPIPLKDGGFKKDKNGNVVTTKLNESFLEKIALKTGGIYVKNTLTSKDIEILYKKISKRGSKNIATIYHKRIYFNRFKWFLIPAFVLLCLFFLVDDRKVKILVIICLLFNLGSINANAANPYFLNKKGIEKYNKGKFNDALKKFEYAYKTDKNVIFLFNKGDSLYKLKNYDNASKVFDDVLMQCKNNILKSKAYFNKGVIAFNKHKFKEALQDFKESIKLNPNDKDAKINYELTLKKFQQNKNQNNQNKEKKNNKNRKKKKNDNKKKQNKQQHNKKQNKNKENNKKQSLQHRKNINKQEKIDKKILNLYNENKELYRKSIKKYFRSKKLNPEKDW